MGVILACDETCGPTRQLMGYRSTCVSCEDTGNVMHMALQCVVLLKALWGCFKVPGLLLGAHSDRPLTPL